MVMKRGDVWWYESPTTSRRPCVVMTRSAAIPVLNRIAIVPITRHARNIPTEVGLDETDGMPSACVATADNVEVIPKSYLTDRITALDTVRLTAICQAISIALGC
jgi:mRNA interferase MazF